ncbi:sulfurtransferase TusA [Bermanella sp. 47_1433_sub80_T6]|nr:sulfurtransferase TusA [Bermanella sp. 47_1433_sub80_T6]
MSNFDLELDATGLMCPEPVMMLHVKVKEMAPGQVLRVLATDPSTTRDIKKFCTFLDFEFLSQDEDEQGVFEYLIKKP